MKYETVKPYLALSRIHVPTGKWFIIAPALWGLTIAYAGFPPLKDLLLFILSGYLVSCIGCTYNDIVDRNIDKKVSRTRNRPLASNQISLRAAIIWLFIQILGGIILLMFMNLIIFKMSILAMGMILIYPWIKRFTYLPQLFLGFAMNYSMLMAYAFVKGNVSSLIIMLYGGSICWTLAYDTIYAHQDLYDDLKINIKSMALLLNNSTKPFTAIAYGIFFASLFLVMFLQDNFSLAGIITSVFLIAFTIRALWKLDINDKKSCAQFFINNNWIGLLVWVILILSYIH